MFDHEVRAIIGMHIKWESLWCKTIFSKCGTFDILCNRTTSPAETMDHICFCQRQTLKYDPVSSATWMSVLRIGPRADALYLCQLSSNIKNNSAPIWSYYTNYSLLLRFSCEKWSSRKEHNRMCRRGGAREFFITNLCKLT